MIKNYELIRELSKCPFDADIGAVVIAERVCPLNTYADGTVDIDMHSRNPEITVITDVNGNMRIEVDLG